MRLLGEYSSGDLDGYRRACDAMRSRLEAFSDRKGNVAAPAGSSRTGSSGGVVLIAHHGDCDGIVGGGLLGKFFGDRGVEVRYASAAEFRLKDLDYFEQAAEGCLGAVFVEAQGMTSEYSRLDPIFLNIDHHPHPDDTPIRRILNPRAHAISPNPAISLVMYELLSDALPAEASWLAAAASIVDYCPAPAKGLIERNEKLLRNIDDIRDTFLASQYVLPHTTSLAAFIATIPSPADLTRKEPFKSRRDEFRKLISHALDQASIGAIIVLAETSACEFRIASPLANRLQDLHPSKCVVVVENSLDAAGVLGDTVRLSVRQRLAEAHLGRLLGRIVEQIGVGDGTGHEKAGSARIPRDRVPAFLSRLEEEIG